jgi:hypothetical protein
MVVTVIAVVPLAPVVGLEGGVVPMVEVARHFEVGAAAVPVSRAVVTLRPVVVAVVVSVVVVTAIVSIPAVVMISSIVTI